MKRLLILSAVTAAAMLNAACVTVIGVDDADYRWTGDNAQPFDGAKRDCRRAAGNDEGSTAFVQCMSGKGWTRVRD